MLQYTHTKEVLKNMGVGWGREMAQWLRELNHSINDLGLILNIFVVTHNHW